MGLLLFFLIAFLSFFQSTLSGGGAALLLMPVLSMLFGAAMMAPIMTIGTSITGLSRLWLFWQDIEWKLVFRCAIPFALAAFGGAYLLVYIDPKWVQLIIGVFLISSIFQFLNLAGITNTSTEDSTAPSNSSRLSLPVFISIGTFVSFLSGLVGGVGPLMNIYYLKYGLDKEKLIATRTANETLIHGIKIITYFSLGTFPFIVIFTGCLIGVAGIVGAILGKKVLKNISSVWFVRMVLITMLVSGVLMIWQAWDSFKPPSQEEYNEMLD